jgi:hypothetical protein
VEESNWINRAGPAIQNSQFLRRLQIAIISGEKEGRWLGELLQHLPYNRSITSLEIYLQPNASEASPSRHNYELEWDIFHMLTPFIENNTNLRIIQLNEGTSSMLSSLALALSSCKNKRLEAIDLNSIESGSDFGEMFASLTAYNNLYEIAVRDSSIELKGWMALSELLQNPTSKIHKLELQGTTLDDDCITTLSISLIRNNSVKLLNMRINPEVSATGVGKFCEVLSHRSCTIENLKIGDDIMDINFTTNLGDALAVNTSLKYLSWNDPLPLEGLRGFAQCLRNPISSLEELDLSNCGINDEGLIVLIRAVQGSVSLKQLLFGGNLVTKRGLMVIFNSLLNGGLTLEVLDLHENDINFDALTEEHWRVLCRALCDNSSIDSTFCSNHTLHGFRLDVFDEDADNWLNEIVCHIESSLEINRRTKCKEEAAREKILKHHFVGGENTSINVFARMPEIVLPFAIEWIGRNSLGYSLMYLFVQQFPLLFDV